jgi:adenylyltransferase/sulfurtransferase
LELVLEDLYIEMYSRQILVEGIGVKGQKILRRSRVAVIGAGATGSSVAEMLARVGIGFLRIVDRDIVDLSNIPRCHLFEYSDYIERKPKAYAVAEKLSRISPYIAVEPLAINVNSDNVAEIIRDVDLVIDALDNLEAKHLLNEASILYGKPYIYIGVEGTYGMVLPVIPGRTPCLRCIVRDYINANRGCDVIGTHIVAVTMVSTIAVSLAIKMLLGKHIEDTLYYVDSSAPEIATLKVKRDPRCPVCSLKRFEMLSKRQRSEEIAEVCGSPGVYISSPSLLESLDLSDWNVDKKNGVTIYRKGSIEIIAFEKHILLLARETREIEEILGKVRR